MRWQILQKLRTMKKTFVWIIILVALLGVGGALLYARPFGPQVPIQVPKQQAVAPSFPQPQSTVVRPGQSPQNGVRPAASSTHQIDSLSTNQGASASLIIGATNGVLIVAVISDPAVIPASVNLFQQTNTGNPILLGIMRDDGLNGDLVAGDGQYTLALNGTSFSAAGTYMLFATAAFRDTILRARSNTVTVVISAPVTTVDATWNTYQDSQFSIETPGILISSSSTSTQILPDGATRAVTFSLPNDPLPGLYIYVYPHGYSDFSEYDEPPAFLGTNNQYDFYFTIRSAPADSTVLAADGLTDSQFHNDILQALATFKTP